MSAQLTLWWKYTQAVKLSIWGSPRDCRAVHWVMNNLPVTFVSVVATMDVFKIVCYVKNI